MRQAWTLFLGGVCCLGAVSAATAQMALPAQKPLTGAEAFQRQCATCHTTRASDPPRQGPTLAGVFERKAGSVANFHYSPGFAAADWTWDAAHLEAWLTNPQAMIPGAIMPYRQANPAVRAVLIDYLKELH